MAAVYQYSRTGRHRAGFFVTHRVDEFDRHCLLLLLRSFFCIPRFLFSCSTGGASALPDAVIRCNLPLLKSKEISQPGNPGTDQYLAVSPGIQRRCRWPVFTGKTGPAGEAYWHSPLPVTDSHNARSGTAGAAAGSSSQRLISLVAVAGITSGITSTPGSPRAFLPAIHVFSAACATHTRITCMCSILAMRSASRGECAIRRMLVIMRFLNSRCIVIGSG